MDKIIHLNARATECWNKFMLYRTMIANCGTGLSQDTMRTIDNTLSEFRELYSNLDGVQQADIHLLAIRELMYLNKCDFDTANNQFLAHIE